MKLKGCFLKILKFTIIGKIFCNLTDIENVNFLQKNILRFYCNKATIDAKKILSIKKKKIF